MFYGDRFLYWGENLCTMEITFCTGEIICALRRSLSVLGREFVYYGDHFLYWGVNLCTMEITFFSGARICVLQRSLSVLGKEIVYRREPGLVTGLVGLAL